MKHYQDHREYYITAFILWVIAALLLLALITGCQNLGNGKLDGPKVNIGDGKLFGSKAAYTIGLSLAQVALYEKPALAESAVSKLLQVKSELVDIDQKYSISKAADIIGERLLDKCGLWCHTVIGQQYVAKVKAKLDDLSALDSVASTITLQDFVDHLLTQIDAVRLSKGLTQ